VKLFGAVRDFSGLAALEYAMYLHGKKNRFFSGETTF
jgi:hypothetical protein